MALRLVLTSSGWAEQIAFTRSWGMCLGMPGLLTFRGEESGEEDAQGRERDAPENVVTC